MKILLVGNPGGTNIADSLLFAARELRHQASLIPVTDAFRSTQLRRHISWRLLGHRPPRLEPFAQRVLESAHAFAPDVIIATGLAPITQAVLRELDGIRRIVYLTDDPWNPDFRAGWFFDALTAYDVVLTPRRANIEDLKTHGCRAVHYLPFGYDARHFHADPQPKSVDGFFAGGADEERIRFLAPILNGDFRISLAGDFWSRSPKTRAFAAGHFDPDRLRIATAAAHINICMVRARNRDGHVMRSLEIPAVGAAMLVQETDEHHELFGDDVVYFNTPKGLDARFRALLADEPLRQRLAAQVHHRILRGGHTYTDRLREILKS